VAQDAVVLSGSIGLGHEMMMRGCAGLLERSGWRTRSLDCMALLGPRRGPMGQRLFESLVAAPGFYDGLHFAHLRTGSGLADLISQRAAARLVPALAADLDRRPADLVLSVFATGAAAAAQLKASSPGRRTVVMCTDVALHRIWVSEGTDLFLVTSPAAAASVRRFLPRAPVSVVPPPVRPAFYTAPSQRDARLALGIPLDEPCLLVIDSGWGFGPLVQSVAALAAAGVHMLAVAGRQQKVERQLRELARTSPRVRPFGFTDKVPELMAAADVVLALPGAVTCSEARVVGRPLLLLDMMPGHGRDNLQHELESGAADVCGPSAAGVKASALAVLDKATRPAPPSGPAPRWEPAYAAALRQVGLELRPDLVPQNPVPQNPVPQNPAPQNPAPSGAGAPEPARSGRG
jgi:processive 1,2-diacylglycerol beta-glucosyltransferase